MEKLFLNVLSSVTIAYKVVKFRLRSPHIQSEGTVSQIFNLGLSFNFMSKKGKHFQNFLSFIFEVA